MVDCYRASPALRARLSFVLGALFFVCAAVVVSPAQGQFFDFLWAPKSLPSVEQDIKRRFSQIDHISSDQLEEQLGTSDVILVDVREAPEFSVSRIPGAVRSAPGISVEDLQTLLPDDLRGKTVVFYCSVGERSSRLAARAKDALMSRGAARVANLEGGIFRWHNERRRLVNARGETDYVHPFDATWGKLVSRQDMTRMSVGEDGQR